jgi:hypothetical protein
MGAEHARDTRHAGDEQALCLQTREEELGETTGDTSVDRGIYTCATCGSWSQEGGAVVL